MPAVSPSHCTTSISSLSDHRESAAQITIFQPAKSNFYLVGWCSLLAFCNIEWFHLRCLFSHITTFRRAELALTKSNLNRSITIVSTFSFFFLWARHRHILSLLFTASSCLQILLLPVPRPFSTVCELLCLLRIARFSCCHLSHVASPVSPTYSASPVPVESPTILLLLRTFVVQEGAALPNCLLKLNK